MRIPQLQLGPNLSTTSAESADGNFVSTRKQTLEIVECPPSNSATRQSWQIRSKQFHLAAIIFCRRVPSIAINVHKLLLYRQFLVTSYRQTKINYHRSVHAKFDRTSK